MAGCLLGILFGQGTHLHDILAQPGEQLNFNLTMHAHSSHDHQNAAHHHSYPTQDRDTHQHQVVTFDIDGVTISSVKVFTDLKVQSGIIPAEHIKSQVAFILELVSLFDLPPPLLKISDSDLSSLSFRGPPAA